MLFRSGGNDPNAYRIYMGPNTSGGSSISDLSNFWRWYFPLKPGSGAGTPDLDISQQQHPSTYNCTVVKSEFRLRDSNGASGSRDQIYSIIYLLFRTTNN